MFINRWPENVGFWSTNGPLSSRLLKTRGQSSAKLSQVPCLRAITTISQYLNKCVCVCLLILEGNFPPAIGKESRRRHRLAVIAQSRRASEGPKWEVRDQLFLEHSSVENNALGDQISQVFPPVWLRCVFFYSLGWRKQRKFACLVVFFFSQFVPPLSDWGFFR